eukprot:6196220-Pleurochrysis_carterae.AAC.1
MHVIDARNAANAIGSRTTRVQPHAHAQTRMCAVWARTRELEVCERCVAFQTLHYRREAFIATTVVCAHAATARTLACMQPARVHTRSRRQKEPATRPQHASRVSMHSEASFARPQEKTRH